MRGGRPQPRGSWIQAVMLFSHQNGSTVLIIPFGVFGMEHSAAIQQGPWAELEDGERKIEANLWWIHYDPLFILLTTLLFIVASQQKNAKVEEIWQRKGNMLKYSSLPSYYSVHVSLACKKSRCTTRRLPSTYWGVKENQKILARCSLSNKDRPLLPGLLFLIRISSALTLSFRCLNLSLQNV